MLTHTYIITLFRRDTSQAENRDNKPPPRQHMGHTPKYVYNGFQTSIWAIIGNVDSGVLGMFSYAQFVIGLFILVYLSWS